MVLLAILTALSQTDLALFSRCDAMRAHDERDRLIAGRSGNIGGWILAVTVFTGIVPSLEAAFRIAQVLETPIGEVFQYPAPGLES